MGTVCSGSSWPIFSEVQQCIAFLSLAEVYSRLSNRDRSNLIAVAIDFWQLQFFEIADLIVNSVAIPIAIASTLTALNWFEDCYKSVEASTFKKI